MRIMLVKVDDKNSKTVSYGSTNLQAADLWTQLRCIIIQTASNSDQQFSSYRQFSLNVKSRSQILQKI